MYLLSSVVPVMKWKAKICDPVNAAILYPMHQTLSIVLIDNNHVITPDILLKYQVVNHKISKSCRGL